VKAPGRKMIFSDIATGEILKDAGGLRQWGEEQRQRAEMAEEKTRRLAEQLRAMGIEPALSG